MDPNQTLDDLRNFIADWEEGEISNQDFAEAMFDNFSILDTWLSNGGFLPDRWNR